MFWSTEASPDPYHYTDNHTLPQCATGRSYESVSWLDPHLVSCSRWQQAHDTCTHHVRMTWEHCLDHSWVCKCHTECCKVSQSSCAFSDVCALPVYRVGGVWVLAEELGEHTLLWEGTSNRKCVPYHCPLGFSVQCNHFADVVDESDKMEPSLVRMSLSDPLSCLVGMDAVGKINSLDREREKY